METPGAREGHFTSRLHGSPGLSPDSSFSFPAAAAAAPSPNLIQSPLKKSQTKYGGGEWWEPRYRAAQGWSRAATSPRRCPAAHSIQPHLGTYRVLPGKMGKRVVKKKRKKTKQGQNEKYQLANKRKFGVGLVVSPSAKAQGSVPSRAPCWRCWRGDPKGPQKKIKK